MACCPFRVDGSLSRRVDFVRAWVERIPFLERETHCARYTLVQYECRMVRSSQGCLFFGKDMGESICPKNTLLSVSLSCSKYTIQKWIPGYFIPNFCTYGQKLLLHRRGVSGPAVLSGGLLPASRELCAPGRVVAGDPRCFAAGRLWPDVPGCRSA